MTTERTDRLNPLSRMRCGLPIITSDRAACPEICGACALLVSPYSVDEMAAAMCKLATEPDLRHRLSKLGLQRAEQFTWEKSIDIHQHTFEEIVAHRRTST